MPQLWEDKDRMLRDLKKAVGKLKAEGRRSFGEDNELLDALGGEKLPFKTRNLIGDIEDILHYYPEFEKYVPENLRDYWKLARRDRRWKGASMNHVARELLKVAKSLAEYEESTKKLGALVKKKFRGHPWKYDKKAKAWALHGEDDVFNFYDGFSGTGSARSKIIKALGGSFEGYKIIADTQDSYVWIGLD